MNLVAPISSLMSTKLVAVTPEASLLEVQTLMNEHNIHHLPVVEFRKIIGMISSSDFLHFLRGFSNNSYDSFVEETRLKRWKAREIMTDKLGKVSSTDPIRTAVDIFTENRFHALPVVDDDQLVGIITTHDIVKAVANEPINLEDYKS